MSQNLGVVPNSILPINRIKPMVLVYLDDKINGAAKKDIIENIIDQTGATNRSTIGQVIADMATANSIERVSRGFMRHNNYRNQEGSGQDDQANAEPPELEIGGLKESDFYEPFAQWLQNEAEEVNFAESLGGSSQRKKWGTPDVIGIYRAVAQDLYQFPKEITSAEIKIDPTQSVVAIGQACAYKLFSHKVYIVMPITINNNKDENAQLEALCLMFGIGLVKFQLNSRTPNFDLRIHAQLSQPDMYYVNEFFRKLSGSNGSLVNKLLS
jgi:hypothetical protein